jgi:hypothetical protein
VSQPEQEGAYLVQRHGHIKALEIAAKQLDEADPCPTRADRWHALAVYCYIKGFCDAPTRHLRPAVLQATLGGIKCPHMVRAWRNRSNVTQCNWARLCRDIFGELTLVELHRRAAFVYAACSWYTRRAGSDTFDGATVPAKGWELIATLAEDFGVAPPDEALGRGAWEAKQKERKHA